MSIVGCDKCGGYYELVEGESIEDFEGCQCGGKLSYVDFKRDVVKKKKYINCPICGHEQERGLKCSKCGSYIRKKSNQGKIRANHRSKYDYTHVLEGKKGINIFNTFDLIDWRGVTIGICFYIGARIFLAVITLILGLFLFRIQQYDELLPVMGILLLISILIPIASGFVTGYVITTRDYLQGMLNGGMVGVVLGFIGGIISLIFGSLIAGFYGQVFIGMGALVVLIMGIILNGIITSIGGLIAVYLRRQGIIS